MAPRKRSASTHALQRSIGRLAVGAAQQMVQAERRRGAVRMGDREEQFQIKVSGRASDYPNWQTLDVIFDQTFSTATGQKMSNLIRPQVRIGYEMETVVTETPPSTDIALPDPGVMLTACVTQWLFDEGADIRGARLQVAAIAPGDNVRFTGFIHASFHGFGSLTEPPDTGE